MGHAKLKHKARVKQQLVNSQENRLYYQNGTESKTPRSESKMNQDRKLADKGPE